MSSALQSWNPLSQLSGWWTSREPQWPVDSPGFGAQRVGSRPPSNPPNTPAPYHTHPSSHRPMHMAFHSPWMPLAHLNNRKHKQIFICVCARVCVLCARALGRQIPGIWANCRSAAKQECHSGRNCNCGPGANKRLFELPVQGWGQWQFSSLDTDPNSTHKIYPQINSLLFCRCSAFFIEKSHISWHLLYLCVLCLCPVSEPPPPPPEMLAWVFRKHALKCRTGKTTDKKKRTALPCSNIQILQYTNKDTFCAKPLVFPSLKCHNTTKHKRNSIQLRVENGWNSDFNFKY